MMLDEEAAEVDEEDDLAEYEEAESDGDEEGSEANSNADYGSVEEK